ncbi:MAG: 50S ribosomal protein L2 [Candidatus Woesearchaeota archaeon]
MGKNLISQRRGKGSTTYRSPSFRFKGAAKFPSFDLKNSPKKGVVKDIVHCPAHTSPLMFVEYEDRETGHLIAGEGMKVNDVLFFGTNEIAKGNILMLRDIPEGTSIYNIESQPGDGGKFVRAGGTAAKVVAHFNDRVIVLLPSKKERVFNPLCRAMIGVVAGSGRTEKPFVKAGKKYHKMRSKNKLYPRVSGQSMNAVDHPHGGSRSSKKGKPTIARRNAPSGAKVGLLRPRRTGRRKGARIQFLKE